MTAPVQRGYYWIGRLPDNHYVLLYADPILKKVHTEIERFKEHIDAIRYCRKNQIRLASVALAENVDLSGKVIPHRQTTKRNLTPQQKDVLSFLLSLANSDGYVTSTLEAVIHSTKLPEGTVRSIMIALYARKILARTEAGFGKRPSTWKILGFSPEKEEGDGEDEDKKKGRPQERAASKVAG